jgi:hypothetical protein
MKITAEHKKILMVIGGVVSLGIVVALATALARPAPAPACPVPTAPPQCPAPPPPPPCPVHERAEPARAEPARAERAERAERADRAERAEPLEQTFADVASTVLSRAGVDDRINPALSSKNGGMLPILDVRGDYEPLMPFEDARCDENGRWNQSSRQQGIRLGLIRDQMKRRVVVQ